MPTAVAAPFRFFPLRVVRTRRLGPSLVRVAFAGYRRQGLTEEQLRYAGE